jgi:multidrug efflux pump subunit AcrB
MNLGELSVRNDRVVLFVIIVAILGGLLAYQHMGRLEDPEFTIKEALIITPYPGASAEDVAREVTNPLESAVQQLGQLDRVESESSRGRSVVRAFIKDRFHRDSIPQVWDELRRKVNDAQIGLPQSVRGNSIIIDDFGDVYGIFLAVTGEGYSDAELRRYAEFLRRELLLVPNVKKVDFLGEQQEVVFLEISRNRLASLGINEDQVYAQLQAKNAAADGGRVRVGEEFLVVNPTGEFTSAEDMLALVIGSDSTGRQLTLGDIATLKRGNEDPPRRLLRYDGKPAIGIGISTVQGGNVVRLGEGVRKRLDELKKDRPLGIQIDEINFQPEAVTRATNDFIFNLVKAVSIVVIVLLFTMGRKTGIVIGFVLFLTIMATFMVMYLDGDILMERISLGALIIALCMLTDNAIIITESLKVRIEAGENKLQVVREAVQQNQWPLFGATAIAVIAFAAIGLSEDRTGEYCNSLFWVILISLTLSWVSAVTVTPFLSYKFFSPVGGEKGANSDPYEGVVFRYYKKMLEFALRFRWHVIIATIVLFALSLYGFGKVDQSFFPAATRPQFMVDVFLPAGVHIAETEKFAGEVERYIKGRPGVTHVTSFVGSGGLRFLLVYSPERENRAYVQFLVDVDDPQKIDTILPDIQKYLDENYPSANAIARKFLLGPGSGGRVQVRFRGPDPQTLRQLAGQAKKIIQDDGHAKGVRDDWRERELVIRPSLLEQQALRNGITRVDVARALETGFQGRVVGFYREQDKSGSGMFQQETRFLPIISRPPLNERNNVEALNSLQIWSPAAGRMIPLRQVASGTEMSWEDPVVVRRDRVPTITVHSDPRSGLPSQLFNRVRERIEQIELPPGYSLQWGGEYEDSTQARAALLKPLPMALTLMVFIVVCLFNSVRTTLVIWMTVPLCIIGVTGGLLLTGQPFGFMALLGVLSLGGEQIKNSTVVLDRIDREISQGMAPYQAVLKGCVTKLRPVLMVAITTVLGMIPLLTDAFFASMAVALMFGLLFACVLTMIFVPVLYAIFYKIHAGNPSGFERAS